MKTRLGFVTNSSSSSFIVAVAKENRYGNISDFAKRNSNNILEFIKEEAEYISKRYPEYKYIKHIRSGEYSKCVDDIIAGIEEIIDSIAENSNLIDGWIIGSTEMENNSLNIYEYCFYYYINYDCDSKVRIAKESY